MKRILVGLDILEEIRVSLVVYMLEIEKGSRKWAKVPRGGPSISNKGNEANSMRDILCSMLEAPSRHCLSSPSVSLTLFPDADCPGARSPDNHYELLDSIFSRVEF
ncbi:hypothetical protein AAG906_037053 [Vitis piasezkii]